jgi:germination protein M
VTDDKGVEIGYQGKEDFVQNIGTNLHSYQKGELKLYFVCSEGDKLKSKNVSVRYNSNMSIEKVIVKELLDGPSDKDLQATFPADTKVLSVSVKDSVCYVNFDEDFLKNQCMVDPNLMVYSLVNSIIEGGNVSKVQILVNGEANVKYQETIDFSQPFSRNLDVVEGEK